MTCAMTDCRASYGAENKCWHPQLSFLVSVSADSFLLPEEQICAVCKLENRDSYHLAGTFIRALRL